MAFAPKAFYLVINLNGNKKFLEEFRIVFFNFKPKKISRKKNLRSRSESKNNSVLVKTQKL